MAFCALGQVCRSGADLALWAFSGSFMLSVPWYLFKHNKKGKIALWYPVQHNRVVFVRGSFSENGVPGVDCTDEEAFCFPSGKAKIHYAVFI